MPKLKTCIVHNQDAAKCGCPRSVSQADFYRTEVTRPELPPIAKLAGEKPMKGPVTVVWETRRSEKPLGGFSSKCIEVRNATETRHYGDLPYNPGDL